MDVDEIVRRGDHYEQTYCGIIGVTQGYYTDGHVDRAAFLAAVLAVNPHCVVEPTRWGWWGRYLEGGYSVQPHPPTVGNVAHVWWRRRGPGHVSRARPHSRGAFSITYLPVEACVGIDGLDNVWRDGKWSEWPGHSAGPEERPAVNDYIITCHCGDSGCTGWSTGYVEGRDTHAMPPVTPPVAPSVVAVPDAVDDGTPDRAR